MDLTGKLEIAGITDAGIKRSQNEDSIGTEIQTGLIMVADGMGGYKGGEVASALAVNTILAETAEKLASPDDNEAPDGEFSPESIIIRDIIQATNDIIYNTSQSQEQYKGMGTTVVLGLFYDNRLTIAHVGDSRMYRVRNDELELVTVDHTLLQELVERGFYTAEEARNSLNKNLVTRALGIDPEVNVDIQEDIALPGDIYLLCSDGLNDMVEDSDIYLTIKRYNDNLNEAAKELVRLANENGGKDNISVVLAKVLEPFPMQQQNWVDKVVDWFF